MLLYILFALLSCGIEEYYYLPQDVDIRKELNTAAVLEIEPITERYATGFTIFYRIYITNAFLSGVEINTENLMRDISASLFNDFRDLTPFADPANNTSITTENTFKNRNYHELELEGIDIKTVFKTTGGTFRINFQDRAGTEPFLSYDDAGTERVYFLLRNNGGGVFTPEPEDRYFFYTPELTSTETDVNNDVIRRSDNADGYAYVSMYIVAIGQNPDTFQRILSKPTHINIFKLPDN
ncbi:MAG: hypothetical protein FWD14_01125 [Treponema sp.]|nr:hypothetical protein [Treponema sp.]